MRCKRTFGIEKEFKCKKCGKEQTHSIGGTAIFNINNKDIEYVDLKCVSCGEKHYVAIEGYIILELTEEAKEKKYQEVLQNIKGFPRNRFFETAKFLLEEERVIHKSEVKDIKNVGVSFF